MPTAASTQPREQGRGNDWPDFAIAVAKRLPRRALTLCIGSALGAAAVFHLAPLVPAVKSGIEGNGMDVTGPAGVSFSVPASNAVATMNARELVARSKELIDKLAAYNDLSALLDNMENSDRSHVNYRQNKEHIRQIVGMRAQMLEELAAINNRLNSIPPAAPPKRT